MDIIWLCYAVEIPELALRYATFYSCFINITQTCSLRTTDTFNSTSV